jgi:NADH-quinone oxidoreductase subunit F
MSALKSLEALEGLRQKLLQNEPPEKSRLRVCMTGCRAYGALQLREALAEELQKAGLQDSVEIRETGCQGFCARAPVMTVDPKGWFYQQVRPEDAKQIVEETLLGGRLLERLVYGDPVNGEGFASLEQIPFYRSQQRKVLGLCGLVDPKSMAYIDGTQLDFVREGLNEGFKFNNPNERDRCGCGESFRV